VSPFLRRDGPTDPRELEWKVRFFAAGAVFALVGMYFEERWMTGTAIVILGVGMFLRYLPGFRSTASPDDESDGEALEGSPND